jgi:hypothetical protein
MKPWMVHFIVAAVIIAAGIAVFLFNRGTSRYVGVVFAVLFAARRIFVGITERRAAILNAPK